MVWKHGKAHTPFHIMKQNNARRNSRRDSPALSSGHARASFHIHNMIIIRTFSPLLSTVLLRALPQIGSILNVLSICEHWNIHNRKHDINFFVFNNFQQRHVCFSRICLHMCSIVYSISVSFIHTTIKLHCITLHFLSLWVDSWEHANHKKMHINTRKIVIIFYFMPAAAFC